MGSIFVQTSIAVSKNSQQGGIGRKIRPSTQIRGLSLRFPDQKKETHNIAIRCPLKLFAFLPRKLREIEEPISSNKDSLRNCSYSTTSKTGEGYVQEESISSWDKMSKQLYALYKFSRPYTIVATVMGITSASLLPLHSVSDLSPTFFVGLLKALVPMVLINIYMVGINDIFDIEIDMINKPNLPLVSGELSLKAGIAIVSISAIVSIAMGVMFKSPPLLCSVLLIFLISTAYSANHPLLRWKKHAVLTLFCGVFTRAILIPICMFSHMQKYVLGRPLVFTKPLIYTVVFMSIIIILIAVVKDIPDEDGDKAFGLRSPSMMLGKEKVFWSSVYILSLTYACAAVVGATSSFVPNKIIMVLGHGILASILWIRAKSVNISDNAATFAFYKLLWKLLYAEYLLFPFVC